MCGSPTFIWPLVSETSISIQDFAQDVFCSLDHVEFDGQSAWGLGCGPDVDDQQKVQMAP